MPTHLLADCPAGSSMFNRFIHLITALWALIWSKCYENPCFYFYGRSQFPLMARASLVGKNLLNLAYCVPGVHFYDTGGNGMWVCVRMYVFRLLLAARIPESCDTVFFSP